MGNKKKKGTGEKVKTITMEQSLHTKIKHRIISYYFGTLKNVIKNFWYWYYVDLYSGDGICECVGIPNHILPLLDKESDKIYDPPFFNLFKYAEDLEDTEDARLSMKFIFNDLKTDKIKKLQKRTKKYKRFVLDYGIEDANEYYKRALNLIKKPERPSLFFLDPKNHKQLKFSTIKGISEFTGKKGRKPELIINLMVFTMLEAVKSRKPERYKTITESLGADIWLTELDEYNSKNKTHELFLKVFIKQLQKLGYQTTHYLVTSTLTKSPLYYLIFCAYKDEIYIIHKKIENSMEKLKNEKWVKETATIAYRIKKIPVSQKTLRNSFQN